MKLLILNGPSLNMLGIREPDIYGRETYKDLCEKLKTYAQGKNVDTEIYQSNHEGDLVDKILSAYGVFDGIIINPAAYTHTSIALLDAVKAVGIPTVEVHISDVDSREDFRKTSYISLAAVKTVKGEGTDGYLKAVDILLEYLK